jgi:Luciferase-like monooxygenase
MPARASQTAMDRGRRIRLRFGLTLYPGYASGLLAAEKGFYRKYPAGLVTVLSTQHPVRLYTDFATLDAVSSGRTQLIVGRGSLTVQTVTRQRFTCIKSSP